MASRDLGPVDHRALPAPDFTSSDQTVTTDTQLDMAHSLAVRPKLWQVILKCNSTDNSYAAGDEILFNSVAVAGGGTSNTAFADTTNITLIQGQTIQILGLASFNSVAITTGKWNWVVRCWR